MESHQGETSHTDSQSPGSQDSLMSSHLGAKDHTNSSMYAHGSLDSSAKVRGTTGNVKRSRAPESDAVHQGAGEVSLSLKEAFIYLVTGEHSTFAEGMVWVLLLIDIFFIPAILVFFFMQLFIVPNLEDTWPIAPVLAALSIGAFSLVGFMLFAQHLKGGLMSPPKKKRFREAQPQTNTSEAAEPVNPRPGRNKPKRTSTPSRKPARIVFVVESVQGILFLQDATPQDMPSSASAPPLTKQAALPPLVAKEPIAKQQAGLPPPIAKEPIAKQQAESAIQRVPVQASEEPITEQREKLGQNIAKKDSKTQPLEMKIPPPVMKEQPVSLDELLKESPLLDDDEQHPSIKLFPDKNLRGQVPSHDNELCGGWRLIGASRIGVGHMLRGRYREDDFEVQLIDKVVALVAIADGVGSKDHSRFGARAVVLGATSIAESSHHRERLHRLASMAQQDVQLVEIEAKVLLIEALHIASDRIKERVQQETKLTIDDLQSTLLVFLVIPYGSHYQNLFVASVQVGDGALYALSSEGEEQQYRSWSYLQQPQILQSGNEVRPFMYTDEFFWKEQCKCSQLENATFVMGMTDGTADDLEPPRSAESDPFVFVNEFYSEHIERIVLPAEQPAQALAEFLGYRKAQSFDDRTVICIYRQ